MLTTQIEFKVNYDLWEREKQQTIFFHSSPQTNRRSILKKDLLAEPPNGNLWDFQSPGIYAHDSLEE